MDIKSDLKMYVEYCKTSRCGKTCKYYKYYIQKESQGPMICMCNYVTSNYNIIDRNKLEQLDARELMIYLYNRCEQEYSCCRSITCIECQAIMIIKDKDLLIRRKE